MPAVRSSRPLPLTRGVHALRRAACVGLAAAAACVAPAHAATPMDLDQYGITGNWYDPAKSGQGFSLEVFADTPGVGQGAMFGGWFTFDTAPGGSAERNRWYSLYGNVNAGHASTLLTIYQNVGGNFDAPPVTKSKAVGTAIFIATSCAEGGLQYDFDDGRSGYMDLVRLTPNVTCATSTPRPTDVDFTYSGNWFERDTSGQGLIFEVNPVAKVFFATWYTYSPTGDTLINPMSQRWYTLQGPYTPGARTVDVTLYETTGGVFDNGTPALTRPVGTAKVQFASCTAATLDYAFTSGTNENLSGQVPLTRVGPTPAGCS
ncbi:MAG: hypothetical protein U1F48_18270 [Burkholderiales bacterium]